MFSDELQAPRFITQPSASGSIVAVGRTKILQCQALGEFNIAISFSFRYGYFLLQCLNFSSHINFGSPNHNYFLGSAIWLYDSPSLVNHCCFYFIVVSVFSSCCFLLRLPPAPVPLAAGRGLHLRVLLGAFLQDPERPEKWRGELPVHRQEQRGQHPQRDDPPHRRLWVDFITFP